MEIFEAIYAVLSGSLSVLTIRSDIKEGLIKNRTLLLFTIMGSIVNILYYSFERRELLLLFLLNFAIAAAVSLVLYFTHSFAGGDSKLAIVLALLYPAGCYFTYNTTRLTLVFAIAAAFFYGYIYLLLYAIGGIIDRKARITRQDIKTEVVRFIKSYAEMMIYMCAINYLFIIPESMGVSIDSWIISISCIAFAWVMSKSSIIKNKTVICCVLCADIIAALITGYVPVSLNPASCLLILALLMCRLTIKTALYEDVKVESLKKGMILTMGSSFIMQTSKVKGLPGVSTEELKSRLSEEEIKSVKKWAELRHVESVTVVKKFPFAVFLALGYLTYFIMWSIAI